MYCKNCGQFVPENENYCKNCGVVLNQSIPNNSNNNNAQENFDEKLIKAFIGEKADKMYSSVKKGGINIWGLLFGIGYFVYRKMYLISALILGISVILGFLLPNLSQYIGFFVGILFCPLYKFDISRKLKKLKKDNVGCDQIQLLNLAKKKGGTSLVGVIIFYAIYMLILFLF